MCYFTHSSNIFSLLSNRSKGTREYSHILSWNQRMFPFFKLIVAALILIKAFSCPTSAHGNCTVMKLVIKHPLEILWELNVLVNQSRQSTVLRKEKAGITEYLKIRDGDDTIGVTLAYIIYSKTFSHIKFCHVLYCMLCTYLIDDI